MRFEGAYRGWTESRLIQEDRYRNRHRDWNRKHYHAWYQRAGGTRTCTEAYSRLPASILPKHDPGTVCKNLHAFAHEMTDNEAAEPLNSARDHLFRQRHERLRIRAYYTLPSYYCWIPKMLVDKKVLSHIAELAQLKIENKQMNVYINSMQNILNLVEQMQAVNTAGIEPMSNPLDGVQRLGADEVTESDLRDYYLQNAPETADGLFLVPKVIE